MDDDAPRRWRMKMTPGQYPHGLDRPYFHGCYFPQTDLCVGEGGARGTGPPEVGVEWLDEPTALMLRQIADRERDGKDREKREET